jgi:hypothetical protein
MAATLTNVMMQTHALDPVDVANVLPRAGLVLQNDTENDFNKTISDELKSSVEAKSAKARAQSRWKMLRNVIHKLEFPKIQISEGRLAAVTRSAQNATLDPTCRAEISSEWLLRLQDFWCGPPLLFKTVSHLLAIISSSSHFAQGAVFQSPSAHNGGAGAKKKPCFCGFSFTQPSHSCCSKLHPEHF